MVVEIPRDCPRCANALEESIDDYSGFKERACPKCFYYESESPAYKDSPERFVDSGRYYFARKERQKNLIVKELSEIGFTDNESDGWIENSPNFNKDILESINRKFTGNRNNRQGDSTRISQKICQKTS